MIDTSCGENNLQVMLEKNIDLIINTHFHEDHIFNNHYFPQAEIWAHQLDAPGMRSIEGFLNLYGCHMFNGEQLGKNFVRDMQIKPSPVHRELRNGDILDFGQTRLQVVHTPGHTPGHIALWEDKHGILISGDIDLGGFGPWYGHLCSNIDDFLFSIEKCRDINPAMILSAHKGIITEDIDARLQSYRDIILFKEQKVLAALQVPQSLDELTDLQIFYGKRIKLDSFFKWFEKMAIYQHLQRLLALGQVKETDGIYFPA
jgi:glyoxylase-like metal-dependent hydrolase (beta-lactamase superfamily II)